MTESTGTKKPAGTTTKPAAAKPAAAKPAAGQAPEPEYVDIDESGQDKPAVLHIGSIEVLLRTPVTAPDDSTIIPNDGCIAWTNLAIDGLVVNLTSHRTTETAALDGLLAAVKFAQIQYGFVPVDRNGNPFPAARVSTPGKQATGQAKAAQPSRPAGQPAAQASKPATTSQPAAEDTTIEHTIVCVKMEVAPVPGKGVGMKFYAAGHNYADIWCTWAEDKALEWLNAGTGYEWDAATLAAVASFTVKFKVIFMYSDKRNSKSNQYKDIVRFEPAA